jgi:hypothetical protein
MEFEDVNRMDVCLMKMGEMLDQFQLFTRAVENELARRRIQESDQTQLQVTDPGEDVPEWLPLVWEHLITRIPWRKGSKRIYVPFHGWEGKVYPSDLSKLKDFRSLSSKEIDYALNNWTHPRIQWCRPGNVQLCRIKDAQ